MNARFFLLMLIFSAAFTLGFVPAAEARPRVAVLEFSNPPGFDSAYAIGAGIAQMLRKRLMDSGRVQVVDRAAIESRKNDLKLSEDGFFDVSTFPQKGGFQGADYILRGKVLDFGHFSRESGIGALNQALGGFTRTKTVAYVRLSVEVIDLRNGRLAFSDHIEARHDTTGVVLLGGDLQSAIGAALKLGSSKFDASMIGKATNKALDQLAAKVNSLFTMEAKVLAVSAEGIVIDMGTTSGIRPGQKGRLFTTREIKNAKGQVVWNSRTVVGEVQVSEVQPEGGLVKGVTGTAKEGDVVVFDQ